MEKELLTIVAKAPKVAKEIEEGKKPEGTLTSVTVTYDMPKTLEGAVEAFGAEPVFDGFKSDFIIYIQGVTRKLLEAGKTPDEIQKEVDALKPGVKRSASVDIEAALRAKMSSMTDEERQAYIASIMGG